uniref:Uncharacterized protein n=1 Tax=Meloidogyne hapla TaxID=6305 RepID=A0A1I8B4T8_MELHA
MKRIPNGSENAYNYAKLSLRNKQKKVQKADCPRKVEGNDVGGQPPGLRPANHFIQTTFAFRDLEALDRDFSQAVIFKLNELRPRLRREALLTLDNENLDCGDVQSNLRCSDYPLNKAFHYLIVEDSRTGAAVYGLSRERNWEAVGRNRAEAEGRLEMALLDALSRHSIHSLLEFGTDNALPGFVREVGIAELERQMRENHEEKLKNKKEKQNRIELRSPFELRMLNLKILAERQPLFADSAEIKAVQGASLLKNFHGSELVEAIEYQTEMENSPAIFVLFWGTEGSLGEHALHLWKRSVNKWKNENKEKLQIKREAVFGVVKCDEEGVELCRAFGVLPKQKPHFLAFIDGQRVGQQMGLGDEEFFINWIRLILLGSLIQIKESADLEKINKELMEYGPYTLGIFRDEQQAEFKSYRRVAVLLAGRYQLAYTFDQRQGRIKKLNN